MGFDTIEINLVYFSLGTEGADGKTEITQTDTQGQV